MALARLPPHRDPTRQKDEPRLTSVVPPASIAGTAGSALPLGATQSAADPGATRLQGRGTHHHHRGGSHRGRLRPPSPPEEGGRVAALSEEDVETGQQDSGPAPLCGRTVVIGREGDVQAPYNPHLSRHHIVPTRPGEKWQGLRDTSLDNKHHLA